jgi:hypothetical protein
MRLGARTALISLACGGLALGGFAWICAARALPKPSSAPGVVIAQDKGKFRILLSGQSIGTEDFEISMSEGKWIVRGTTVAHTAGGDDMKTTGELHLAADGTPIHYAWSTDSPKKASGQVDFDSGTAIVVVLDNNLYEQYAILARLYNWGAGGEQSFPVLIPQDITPGTIKVSAAGGASGGLAELVVKSADLEIHLFCDGSHKLVRLEVPASRVVVERQ